MCSCHFPVTRKFFGPMAVAAVLAMHSATTVEPSTASATMNAPAHASTVEPSNAPVKSAAGRHHVRSASGESRMKATGP